MSEDWKTGVPDLDECIMRCVKEHLPDYPDDFAECVDKCVEVDEA